MKDKGLYRSLALSVLLLSRQQSCRRRLVSQWTDEVNSRMQQRLPSDTGFPSHCPGLSQYLSYLSFLRCSIHHVFPQTCQTPSQVRDR